MNTLVVKSATKDIPANEVWIGSRARFIRKCRIKKTIAYNNNFNMNIISFYRVSRWCYLHRIPILPRIIQALIFLLFNSKITPETKIGKGTYCVCKGVSTVLIPGTEIGENCVLGLRFSTVRKFPYKNVPKIGNNVFIGPNVVICGPVEIGDNCIIAANSFVDKSLMSGVIVAGSPTKIIGYTKDLNYDISANQKDLEGIAPYLQPSKK